MSITTTIYTFGKTSINESQYLNKSQTCHTGFHSTSFPFSLAGAVSFILDLLYLDSPLPSSPYTRRIAAKQYRNQAIRERYAAGETLDELARDFGISEQRIHEIASQRA